MMREALQQQQKKEEPVPSCARFDDSFASSFVYFNYINLIQLWPNRNGI